MIQSNDINEQQPTETLSRTNKPVWDDEEDKISMTNHKKYMLCAAFLSASMLLNACSSEQASKIAENIGSAAESAISQKADEVANLTYLGSNEELRNLSISMLSPSVDSSIKKSKMYDVLTEIVSSDGYSCFVSVVNCATFVSGNKTLTMYDDIMLLQSPQSTVYYFSTYKKYYSAGLLDKYYKKREKLTLLETMGDVITNFKVKDSGHTDYNGNDFYYEVIRSKETNEELTIIYTESGILINGFEGYSSLTSINLEPYSKDLAAIQNAAKEDGYEEMTYKEFEEMLKLYPEYFKD